MDGWMDGWVGGWVGRWISGWVDGWMDGYSHTLPRRTDTLRMQPKLSCVIALPVFPLTQD